MSGEGLTSLGLKYSVDYRQLITWLKEGQVRKRIHRCFRMAIKLTNEATPKVLKLRKDSKSK